MPEQSLSGPGEGWGGRARRAGEMGRVEQVSSGQGQEGTSDRHMLPWEQLTLNILGPSCLLQSCGLCITTAVGIDVIYLQPQY